MLHTTKRVSLHSLVLWRQSYTMQSLRIRMRMIGSSRTGTRLVRLIALSTTEKRNCVSCRLLTV